MLRGSKTLIVAVLTFALVAIIFGILQAVLSTYAQTSGATMDKVTSGGTLSYSTTLTVSSRLRH